MSTHHLRILRAAHLLQRLVRWVMLHCLLPPARVLQSALRRAGVPAHTNHHPHSNSSRMVSTRRQRGSQESLQHALQRLRDHHSQQEQQQQHEPVSNKLAAVLVALFEGEDGCVRVWLTQRAQHLNSHQGEWCLPGGKRDATDPDDAFTAKREAAEEMGLQPDSVQVLCQLAPMLSKHLLSVTPVVAQVPASFVPQPNPDEVQAVLSMPLSCFLDAQRHLHWDVRSKTTPGRVFRVHSFDYQGQVIWGLTAAILIQVAELALGRPPDFQVKAPSSSASGSSSSRAARM